ncbi:MAG: twin-arginine translocation signal domain-containing protein, partial [Caldilineaceae bacterium]
MPIHLTRRDFLKSSAALVAALSVAAWFPAPRRAAGYSPQLPAQLPAAPAFTPLPSSQLATGKPVADIAAGWDGTLWAVDSLGIPHLYDPIAAAWQPFGQGVDAATVLNDEIYLFRGPDVAVYNQTTGQTAVQPIAQQWPSLPPSFTTDLDGAAAIDGVIYLYRSSRYV